MTEVATIERNDVEVTPTSWRPTGDMSFEDWCEAGHKLGQLSEAVQWWLGDWLNYGTHKFSHKYLKAIDATGYEKGTLKNIASVAGKFDPSRRRDNLSWSHHVSVSSLPQREQDDLLARAEEQEWSREQLRGAVRGDPPRTVQSGSNGNGKVKRQDPSLTITVAFSQTFRNKQIKRTNVAALKAEAERLGFTEKRLDP